MRDLSVWFSLLCALPLGGASAQEPGRVQPRTWEQIEDGFETQLPLETADAWPNLNDSDAMGMLREIPSQGLMELIADSRYPVAEYSGYRILCERLPDSSLRFALSYLSSGYVNQLFREHPLRVLRNAKPNEETLESLSICLSRPQSKEGRMLLGMALSYCSTELLQGWVADDRDVLIPASNVSLVLSQLLSRNRKRRFLDSSALAAIHQKLKELALVPGFSQVVYLAYLDVGEEVPSMALDLSIQLLEDDSITDDEFLMAVHQKQPLLKAVVEYDMENLSVLGRRRINKAEMMVRQLERKD